jgi:DNA-binding protein HU-beta
MNKQDLIERTSEVSGLSQKDSEKAVQAIFGTQTANGVIIDALAGGEQLELVGFGNFRAHKRGGRTGRNPQTGAPVEIPDKTIPKFKPGKRFTNAIPQ